MNGALTAPAAVQRARHTLKIKNLIYKEMVTRGLQLAAALLYSASSCLCGDGRCLEMGTPSANSWQWRGVKLAWVVGCQG